jgi:hypothetical protein
VTLQQAHHGNLADHRLALRGAKPHPLRGVHVLGFAAGEGFVDFAFAVLLSTVLAGRPGGTRSRPS